MDSLQILRMAKLAAQITATAQAEESDAANDTVLRGKLVPRGPRSARKTWAGTTKLLRLWNEISELDRAIVRKIVVEQRSPLDPEVIEETGLSSEAIIERLESISRKLRVS